MLPHNELSGAPSLGIASEIKDRPPAYDVTQTYRDYKKFGSQSKITVVGEAPAEKL
jgi:hypothetical protein